MAKRLSNWHLLGQSVFRQCQSAVRLPLFTLRTNANLLARVRAERKKKSESALELHLHLQISGQSVALLFISAFNLN